MDIFQETKGILWRSGRISLELYKIMIPIIIAVKILQDLGLIAWLALPLAPVMHLVGLPGEMGLVWATALVNNIYGSMIVFVSLAGQHDLTVAQVTVLGVMILIAHGLPVELQIVRKSGPRMGFQAFCVSAAPWPWAGRSPACTPGADGCRKPTSSSGSLSPRART
jgi:hypothetical protein